MDGSGTSPRVSGGKPPSGSSSGRWRPPPDETGGWRDGLMRGGVVLLGVLTVVVQAGVVGGLGLTLAGRGGTAAPQAHVAIVPRGGGSAVVLATLVAVGATRGRLYPSPG